MRRRALAVAAVVCTAITVVGCTGGGSKPGAHKAGGGGGTSARPGVNQPARAVDDPKNIPDAAALRKAAEGLPADPAQAATALVGRMFGDDAKAAVAATGELLRRAGLPIVSGKGGPPVAMPDTITITNAPVGVELLPSLTQLARTGIAYDLDQVRGMLQAVGAPEAELTDRQLVTGLAAWGKGAADPAVTRYAGAAERALAARHGQLLDPAQVLDAKTAAALRDKPESLPLEDYNRLIAEPDRVSFDPVQFLLLAAHADSEASDKPVVTQVPSVLSGATPTDHHSLAAVDFGTCADIAGDFDGEVPGAVKGHAKATLQEYLKQDIEATIGKEAAEDLEKGWGNFDKLTDVLSTIAFVTSLRFDVAPLGKGTTHFLHDESAHANDVKVQAHAYFKATVPEDYRPCFALAGIGLPSNKDLKDIEITWTLPNGRVALKPATVGDRQFDHPVALDESGLSTVQLTPRRELHPPKSGDKEPVATALQQVKASLDKDWLEAHISDLIPILFQGYAGVGEALDNVLWNTLLNMIKKFSLPSVVVTIPVTYHGSNVYRILGDGSVNVIFEGTIGLKSDLYSCKGLRGPWQGTIAITGTSGPLLEAAGHMLGIKAKGSGTDVVRGSFLLNEKVSQPQKFTFSSKYGLVVELDQDAIDKGLQTGGNYAKEGTRIRRVGVASWLIGGQDVRVVGSLLGSLFSQGTEIPVEAADGDLRCPGTAIYQDPFDD
jgi:hypothetical protein